MSTNPNTIHIARFSWGNLPDCISTVVFADEAAGFPAARQEIFGPEGGLQAVVSYNAEEAALVFGGVAATL